MPRPARLVSSLADTERLSLYARLVCAGAEGLPVENLQGGKAGKRPARLLRDGLVRRQGDRVVAVMDVFTAAMREHKAETVVTDPVETHFQHGRLVTMPAKRPVRLSVLERIAERLFAPGVEYTEKQVNAAALTCFDDPSTLRRYLVEEGLLEREADGSRYRLP